MLATDSREHQEFIQASGNPHVDWVYLGRPTPLSAALADFKKKPQLDTLVQLASGGMENTKVSMLQSLHKDMLYRFSELSDFSTLEIKKDLWKHERFKDVGIKEYGPWMLPESPKVFNMVKQTINSRFWGHVSWLRDIFDANDFDTVCIAFPQCTMGYLICQEATRRGIPVIAYINSWDHPTNKGPIPHGISRFMVWNRPMKDELVRYHDLPEDRIEVVGAAHWDTFRNKEQHLLAREEFLSSIGADPEAKLLFYGAYPKRISPQEPQLLEELASKVSSGKYGNVALVIRPHPLDIYWKEMIGHLNELKNVIVRPSSKYSDTKGATDLDELINLLHHSDILCTGPSTLTLDALCFDTPVINIGFGGDLDTILIQKLFQTTHYTPVMQSGCSKLANNFKELETYIHDYLNAPHTDEKQRNDARNLFCSPFDGQAGKRIVSEIISF